jgi:hypothetical protein
MDGKHGALVPRSSTPTNSWYLKHQTCYRRRRMTRIRIRIRIRTGREAAGIGALGLENDEFGGRVEDPYGLGCSDEAVEDAALKVLPAVAEGAHPRGEAKGEVGVNETRIWGWSYTPKQHNIT